MTVTADLETADPETAARVPEDWWDSFVPPPSSRAEIIRGVLSLTPSPSDAHCVIQSSLIRAFTLPDGYVAVSGAGWKLTVGGIVAMAPELDVMVCRWDAKARTLVKPPLLGVEVLSPSDVAPWEGMTRIVGKRLDYAQNSLDHYLEVDMKKLSISRWARRDKRKLAIVERVTGNQIMSVSDPFPYTLQPSALIVP